MNTKWNMDESSTLGKLLETTNTQNTRLIENSQILYKCYVPWHVTPFYCVYRYAAPKNYENIFFYYRTLRLKRTTSSKTLIKDFSLIILSRRKRALLHYIIHQLIIV